MRPISRLLTPLVVCFILVGAGCDEHGGEQEMFHSAPPHGSNHPDRLLNYEDCTPAVELFRPFENEVIPDEVCDDLRGRIRPVPKEKQVWGFIRDRYKSIKALAPCGALERQRETETNRRHHK